MCSKQTSIIELLREKQKNLSLESIKNAKNEFIAYLEALEESDKKNLAIYALLTPKKRGEYAGKESVTRARHNIW